MRYFDYKKVAREPSIPPAQLARLCMTIRKDFPADDLLYELHVLRARMAVRDGYAKIEDILPAMPLIASPRRQPWRREATFPQIQDAHDACRHKLRAWRRLRWASETGTVVRRGPKPLHSVSVEPSPPRSSRMAWCPSSKWSQTKPRGRRLGGV